LTKLQEPSPAITKGLEGDKLKDEDREEAAEYIDNRVVDAVTIQFEQSALIVNVKKWIADYGEGEAADKVEYDACLVAAVKKGLLSDTAKELEKGLEKAEVPRSVWEKALADALRNQKNTKISASEWYGKIGFQKKAKCYIHTKTAQHLGREVHV